MFHFWPFQKLPPDLSEDHDIIRLPPGSDCQSFDGLVAPKKPKIFLGQQKSEARKETNPKDLLSFHWDAPKNITVMVTSTIFNIGTTNLHSHGGNFTMVFKWKESFHCGFVFGSLWDHNLSNLLKERGCLGRREVFQTLAWVSFIQKLYTPPEIQHRYQQSWVFKRYFLSNITSTVEVQMGVDLFERHLKSSQYLALASHWQCKIHHESFVLGCSSP